MACQGYFLILSTITLYLHSTDKTRYLYDGIIFNHWNAAYGFELKPELLLISMAPLLVLPVPERRDDTVVSILAEVELPPGPAWLPPSSR